jgi:hypothetical protein
VGGDRTKPDWELAAEELCRHVRTLLDEHGDAIQEALEKTLTKDEAKAQLRQIELLIQVMEIELWRKGRRLMRNSVTTSQAG